MIIGRLIGSDPGIDTIFQTAFEALDNPNTNYQDTIGSIETINAYFGGSAYRLSLAKGPYDSQCYFRDACLVYENGTTAGTSFSATLLAFIDSVVNYLSVRHTYYFDENGDRTADLDKAVETIIIDPCLYKTQLSGGHKIQLWSSYVSQNSPYVPDFRRGRVDLSNTAQSQIVNTISYTNNPTPMFDDVKINFHLEYNQFTGYVSDNQLGTIVEAVEDPINQKFESLSSLFVSR